MIAAPAELKRGRGEKEQRSVVFLHLFPLSPFPLFGHACNHDFQIS